MNYLTVLFFSLIGGLFSLAGGLFLLSNKKSAASLTKIATPFAAGALLAATFAELIPEALHDAEAETISFWILGGLTAFFMLEYFFHYYHHHDDHSKESTPVPLLLIGDTLHNLLDGVAIGAAFLVDTSTGIVTTLAIAAHEIPQEIGDFGVMLRFGYPKRKVVLFNAFSALAATIGALVIYALGSEHELPTGILLAIIAGMFIYIAASDLMPIIHQDAKHKKSYAPLVIFLIGLLTVTAVTSVAHRYIEDGHHQEEQSSQHVDEHNEELDVNHTTDKSSSEEANAKRDDHSHNE